jgi:hypothetical protein
MKYILAVSCILALSACDPAYHENDNKIVCSLGGKAYFVKQGSGDTSFIVPSSSADALCAKLKVQ